MQASKISLLIFLFVSGSLSACITDDLTIDKAITINNSLTESTLKCAVVYNSHLNEDIFSLISDTVNMLNELNGDDNKYGEISFLNAMTIDQAIEALNKFLTTPENIVVQSIIEYDMKMREYFETYILDDLNELGLKKYNILLDRQVVIINSANEYASNLLIVDTDIIKVNIN